MAAILVPAFAHAQAPATSEQRIDMPMTASQRIYWIVDGTVGPQSLGVGVIASAWNTAWNFPEEWGQTWTGAGKRYLEREADVAISNSIEAGLGALWGERANYVPSHEHGVRRRLGYALNNVFLAYHPDGQLEFGWARLAGNTVNNVIENTWLPPSATTWQQTVWRSASGYATRAIGNVWAEFWPDASRHLFKRR